MDKSSSSLGLPGQQEQGVAHPLLPEHPHAARREHLPPPVTPQTPRPLLPAQCVCERSLCRLEPPTSSLASVPGSGSHSHFPDSLRADCNH